jgi:hypothetical protein
LKYSHIAIGVIRKCKQKAPNTIGLNNPLAKLFVQNLSTQFYYKHVVYDISFGSVMKKIEKKKFKCSELYEVKINPKKYKLLRNYLEIQVDRAEQYNYLSYFWNFCCFVGCCFFPLKGEGMICSEILAESFKNSGILKRDMDPLLTKTYSMRVGDVLSLIKSNCDVKLMKQNTRN